MLPPNDDDDDDDDDDDRARLIAPEARSATWCSA
jgi:hypothetical protein